MTGLSTQATVQDSQESPTTAEIIEWLESAEGRDWNERNSRLCVREMFQVFFDHHCEEDDICYVSGGFRYRTKPYINSDGVFYAGNRPYSVDELDFDIPYI